MKIHKICYDLFRFKLLKTTFGCKQKFKKNKERKKEKKNLKIKMTTVPLICILLLLILKNQAQETITFVTKGLEEELNTDNSTVDRKVESIVIKNTTRVKELEPLEVIVTENSLKIAPEVAQQVLTENAFNNDDLKENTTELNILENKIISTDELHPNITTNEKAEIVLKTYKKEIQTISNTNGIEGIQTISISENEKTSAAKVYQNHSENKETSSSSLSSAESIESTTITIIENEVTTKPLVTLEEYALKQMNFIIDYLLIETQEFVAKVLQASINTVFQRDNLKRYAEGLNRLLNPDTDSDYSDEFVEPRNLIQNELYEEIVLKLNFLKSKPSKYLQRQIPQDWIREYRHKRAELTIWLDKASEQMHREFNRYISEEEDYIKYQYFNEAFDDISRATEIHQKLALLADLVKIVKNKKKITFMDLYMQS